MKHTHYRTRAWQGDTKAVAGSRGPIALTDKLTKRIPLILLLPILAILIWWSLDQDDSSVRLQTGDGVAHVHETDAATVAEFLDKVDVLLHPGDMVVPSLDSPISDGLEIEVYPARDFIVTVDGKVYRFTSTAATPGQALDALGLVWSPHDKVTVNGVEVLASPPVATGPPGPLSRDAATSSRGSRWDVAGSILTISSPLPAIIARTWPKGGGGGDIPDTIEIDVVGAKTLRVDDGGRIFTVHTTAETVGRALFEEGIPVFLFDTVRPAKDSHVVDGLEVEVERARRVTVLNGDQRTVGFVHARTVGEALQAMDVKFSIDDNVSPGPEESITDVIEIRKALPVTLLVDGKQIHFASAEEDVAGLLHQAGVMLGEKDIVSPPPSTPVADGMIIRVIRVEERFERVEEPIPYAVVEQPDDSLYEGQSRVQPGKEGLKEVFYRITTHDGVEAAREFVDDAVIDPPVDEVRYFGTKKGNLIETGDGPVAYRWSIDVLATYYYPSTCGKAPGSPGYGVTATGRRATRGIVAVDPRVIPLHSRLYIPGYGFGVAEDTGGMIKGKRIDLCFDDGDSAGVNWGKRWVTIYVLE